jgi:hypothetical protein
MPGDASPRRQTAPVPYTGGARLPDGSSGGTAGQRDVVSRRRRPRRYARARRPQSNRGATQGAIIRRVGATPCVARYVTTDGGCPAADRAISVAVVMRTHGGGTARPSVRRHESGMAVVGRDNRTRGAAHGRRMASPLPGRGRIVRRATVRLARRHDDVGSGSRIDGCAAGSAPAPASAAMPVPFGPGLDARYYSCSFWRGSQVVRQRSANSTRSPAPVCTNL